MQIYICVLWILKKPSIAYIGTHYHYGMPAKIIDIVKIMYRGIKCAVIDGNGRTEWFQVKSGVKQ